MSFSSRSSQTDQIVSQTLHTDSESYALRLLHRLSRSWICHSMYFVYLVLRLSGSWIYPRVLGYRVSGDSHITKRMPNTPDPVGKVRAYTPRPEARSGETAKSCDYSGSRYQPGRVRDLQSSKSGRRPTATRQKSTPSRDTDRVTVLPPTECRRGMGLAGRSPEQPRARYHLPLAPPAEPVAERALIGFE